MKIIATALAVTIGSLPPAKAQLSEEAIQAAIDMGYRTKLLEAISGRAVAS